tara:strand:+ start:52 stop:411 length:360 start_codon:yes stop_codon:yes gene_type:complete
MINYYEKIDFNQTVYTLSPSGLGLHEYKLGALAKEHAAEANTPHGIAPRMFIDGNELLTWEYGGNYGSLVVEFKTNEQAEHALLLCHLYDLVNHCDAPNVFYTPEDAEAAYGEYLEVTE